jgi:hypothetical protein
MASSPQSAHSCLAAWRRVWNAGPVPAAGRCSWLEAAARAKGGRTGEREALTQRQASGACWVQAVRLPVVVRLGVVLGGGVVVHATQLRPARFDAPGVDEAVASVKPGNPAAFAMGTVLAFVARPLFAETQADAHVGPRSINGWGSGLVGVCAGADCGCPGRQSKGAEKTRNGRAEDWPLHQGFLRK